MSRCQVICDDPNMHRGPDGLYRLMVMTADAEQALEVIMCADHAELYEADGLANRRQVLS